MDLGPPGSVDWFFGLFRKLASAPDSEQCKSPRSGFAKRELNLNAQIHINLMMISNSTCFLDT